MLIVELVSSLIGIVAFVVLISALIKDSERRRLDRMFLDMRLAQMRQAIAEKQRQRMAESEGFEPSRPEGLLR